VAAAYARPVADLEQLPAWALELLARGRVARLGLVDLEGAPRVQPVTFALHAGRLWSAIDAKPKRVPPERLARVRFIAREPRVSLTVDRYEEDWARLAWVQVLARAALVGADGPAGAGALRALREKYPQYRSAPPAGPLLELTPRRFLWWSAR
jgi:PPOX class probable F420-dependent enzyme